MPTWRGKQLKLGPRLGEYFMKNGKKRYLRKKDKLGASKYELQKKKFRQIRNKLKITKEPNMLETLWEHVKDLSLLSSQDRQMFKKDVKKRHKQLTGKGLQLSK
jgi:hypothetical protein